MMKMGRELLVFVALGLFVATATASSFPIQQLNELRSTNVERDKRYTDTQDRALAFCTGLCMYEKKKIYSDCYDLCDWNGKGESPWTKLEGVGGGSSITNMGALMRNGAGGGGMTRQRGGRRFRAGSNKKNRWEVGL